MEYLFYQELSSINNKKECNKIRLSFLTNNKEEIVKGVEIMKKIIIDKME